MEYPQVPPEFLARMRRAVADLPEIIEEPAWTGMRWRVRTKTFVHILAVEDNSSPAFARAAATAEAVTVCTFRSMGPELVALRNSGHPFFAPPWGANVVGMVIDAATDWDEVKELVSDSYCIMAPKKLSARVNPV